MSRWEAVVVGGGPGGSTAAWRLAQAGWKVLLLDAAVFPRVKLCAGWVTRQALTDLDIDPADYPHTIQPFRSVFVGYGDRLRETRWDQPASFGIVRKEFDTHLLRRAEAAGAEVREGVRVRSAEEGTDCVRLDLGNEWVEGEAVVGAGGHSCPVARSLGKVSEREIVILTQESETDVGADRLRAIAPHYGRPELIAEPDFKGYGWYFTKGGFLNIGVGCIGKAPSVHERRDALLERLRRTGLLPKDLELVPFKGHAYTLRRGTPRRLAGRRFVLVGDAAGLARDFSGEGIGPAARSARLAAEAILEWRRTGAPLEGYARRIEEAYGDGEEGLLGRLVDWIPGTAARALARALCRYSWPRRKIVLEGAFGIG